ncbi:MAG: 16S rRNA (uracil(1498)-N(3))-methyltransferase [Alphaproteobacteria bacterium]|nr:16S rRNA (uracil(1498)-N(3))-methyltransferase [Alphaproteobacteria bacterium]
MTLRHTHRIHAPARLAQGSVVTPDKDQTHHLLHVLRLKTGDILRLFNGRDGEFRASVASAGKRDMTVTLHEQLRAPAPEPDLWLCCAPIKKAHFDFMLEKATELGVAEIQPVLTQRTQIREVNGDRAHAICREAAEQSERLNVPAIGNPVSLDDLIDVFPKDRAMVVCAEWGDAMPVHDALAAINHANQTKAAIVTGPEGGFAAEELEKLRKHPNAVFVRLGPRILRADTAAIAALACWQAVCGNWK